MLICYIYMVCKNCLLYEKFKEECHFYWKDKRKCTQFIDKETGMPKFKNKDDEFEKLLDSVK